MPLMYGKSDRSFQHNVRTEMHHDKPLDQSLAIAYSIKRRAEKDAKKYAEGGLVDSEHCPDCDMGQCDVHNQGQSNQQPVDGSDILARVMEGMKAKKMSEGGRIANQEHGYRDSELAGFSPNEFDDLVLRDDLDFSYTGANSGDEIGCPEEDERRRDIVAQIMRSRRK